MDHKAQVQDIAWIFVLKEFFGASALDLWRCSLEYCIVSLKY